MPPKQRITREMILERSFAMFCREGMEAVNARSVAKALSCSTQPIFSYFAGMEDLRNAIEQKAKETFAQAMEEVSAEGSFLACSTAYIRLASEQPRLFARLLMTVGEEEPMPLVAEGVEEKLKDGLSSQYGLDAQQADRLYRDLWTYAHGLASLVAAGRLAFDEQAIADRLAFVSDALAQRVRG